MGSCRKPHAGYLFAIMKVKKRCIDILNNNKLIGSLLDKNRCIFKEVRKLRKKAKSLSSIIDDNVEPQPYSISFFIYSKLFNNVETDESALENLEKSIKNSIVQSSISVIDQIDVETVREDVLNMKPNKRD